eukprot:Plantae.Rhodophyta-Purpureofilum_apyrenoidigerum.ctg12491.p1 GENE.Plantae.Rhodophyta-Purpureofilum_apyrenoidigerum.ctg12491~~Plantae.Rhodophyta-Purpureofilum_apyrenoidigerum.ctg12491.p1  ORF type:complete len:455 (+),score=92.12 Plantae.Rhodophyta-Purpureofilum_apyrenoidigerum.ctg12491:155-1366(+)
MEDAHIAKPKIADKKGMFAVFDGHGGAEVALFCEKHMVEELQALEEYRKGDFEKALTRVFHRMDELIADEKYSDELERLKQERANYNKKESSPEPDQDALENGDTDSSPTKEQGDLEMDSPEPSGAQPTDPLGDDHEGNGDNSPTIPSNMQSVILRDLQASSDESTNKKANAEPGSGNAIVLTFDSQNGARIGSSDTRSKLSTLIPMNLLEDQQCRLVDHRVVAGCTAVVALVVDDELIVANAGDSKAVLCRGGNAIGMSFEHKPFNDVERRRIEAAGGFVSAAGRVNNNLNLSRSIGDLKYKGNTSILPKDQMITSEPDINREKIHPEDEFLIIACDGVWDVMQNQDAVDFVRGKLKTPNIKLSQICEEIFMKCLAQDPRRTSGLGGDNMTAVIVRFNHAKR